MNATARFANIQSSTGVVVGVDIAESVFQLCEADTKWQRRGKHRLTRAQFERWFDNRDVALVVNQQHSQVGIALFADAAQPALLA